MYFLGFNCYGHNASAALLRGGEIIGAVEEERLNRQKHSGKFPELSVHYLMKFAGIESSDLTGIGYYWEPWREFRSASAHMLRYLPESRHLVGGASFTSEYRARLPAMLRVRSRLEQVIGPVKRSRFSYIPHHRCHAASAFFPSGFERAAVLSIDMLGEWTSTMFAVGEGLTIKPLDEIAFPHSLGMVYAAFTQYLGFEPINDEWKVMGLAPYGKPRFMKLFEELIELLPRGRFRVNTDLVAYHVRGRKQMLRPSVTSVVGPSRCPDAELQDRHADIAASLQRRIADAMLHCVHWLHESTGATDLCLAGGVALNCAANGEILERTRFRRVFVQPAAHDAGTSLGAALHLAHGHGAPRVMFPSVYLGPSYSDGEIVQALNGASLAVRRPDDLEEEVAALLAAGLIVGWFQGSIEYGPRALGNRSILADPRDAGMKDKINSAVKFRESFRPFAASVLAEHQGEWFTRSDVSPYMTINFRVRKERSKQVPAVVHEDGTCRLQTVVAAQNPRYWRLIDRFRRRTSVPMLLNTSFNVKGEPIVCTPEDAVKTFLACGLDALVAGNFLAQKIS
jgi:carbamoyltransferase